MSNLLSNWTALVALFCMRATREGDTVERRDFYHYFVVTYLFISLHLIQAGNAQLG